MRFSPRFGSSEALDIKTGKRQGHQPGAGDKNVICTMIYGVVQHDTPLGSDFQSGKTYTVKVNAVTQTFVAQQEAIG